MSLHKLASTRVINYSKYFVFQYKCNPISVMNESKDLKYI